MASDIRTIWWEDGKVRYIDQTLIPEKLVTNETTDYHRVAEAIRTMEIRGAPAIGVTAALGMALGATSIPDVGYDEFMRRFREIGDEFAGTRPTAVNLFWAIDRMIRTAQENSALSVDHLKKRLLDEALAILEEDIDINRTLGRNGAELLKDGDTVLTHCNAGALACAAYGTALGMIRAAVESGKRIKVIADETRPRLQGMKLTAWELAQAGIPVTVITDNMAGFFMRKGMIDCVVVGADRIAANGDVANKVGTYGIAVLARTHGIPFYVAAPISTVDRSLPNGDDIPIEERCTTEVTHISGVRVAPEGICVMNPAFDITPAEYVSAVITEKGVLRPPYEQRLRSTGT